MNIPDITGRTVKIEAGDVFDQSQSPNPFENGIFGDITDISSNAAIAAIKLQQPFNLLNTIFSHAVVSTRHEQSMAELLQGKNLPCAVTLVPQTRFSAKSPFDLSWWRGGSAAIAMISLA